MAVLTALLSIGAIVAWYALFRNQTAIHGGFMVRLLARPIGVGPACLLLAAFPLSDRTPAQAPRPASDA